MPIDRRRLALFAVAPLVLLGGLLWWIVRSRPADSLRGDLPPVERLVIERIELAPGEVHASVLNDGPDPVTIAQVQVDDAYWRFTQQPAGPLSHLARARLTLDYPWVHGETHVLRLVSSTGLTFERDVAVAVETPRPSARFFGMFALIGLYVGVLPVALGLLWFPLIGRLGPRAMDFLLALTLGLLVFLFVDTAREGREAAAAMPKSYQGIALLVFGAAAAYLAIEILGAWLGRRESRIAPGWVTALLVAVGIGLHNFGEGLAIGAALALGEAALGTLLIVGFTLHNTTEGLAIVAPLAGARVPIARLLQLGLIGGVPTVFGAWLGGTAYSTTLSTLFLALGAGAVAQVIVQIARGVAGSKPLPVYLRQAPVVLGLLAGFALMYTTGMLVQ